MNDEIREKLYSLIDEIENSEITKNLDKYKYLINNNSKIKKLIEDFNIKKENKSFDLQQSKINLYKVYEVSNYLHYENELNFLIIKLNKELNSLIDMKGCR